MLTVEEFSHLPDEPGKQELSNGELIIAPPAKYGHLVIAHRLYKVIGSYLDRAGSGEVFLEPGFQLGPDTIRQPDVAVLLTSRRVNHDEWPRAAPDVAIEVISPANSAEEIETKTAQYLAADARSVWIVYPKTRRVRIYRADGSHTAIEEPQSLTDENVLPGFALPLAELFAD